MTDYTRLRLALADAQALIQSVALELEANDPAEPKHASEAAINAALSAGRIAVTGVDIPFRWPS